MPTLARSRSTRRLDKQQQHASKHQAGSNGLKNRRSQPPLKRRRILNHSSTGTSESSSDSAAEDDDADEELASSSRETDQSSEHDDNERDSDYVNEISAAEEDQTTPRAHRRQQQHHQQQRKIVIAASSSSSSASDASMSESDASSSSSDAVSSHAKKNNKKALTPVEANALRKEMRGSRKVGTSGSQSLQKQAKVAARKLRRDVPTMQTLNRFPPSPVKLLPNAGRRGFQVRPDAPNPFSLDLPSASSSSSASRHRANGARATATIQAGLRRFAGKMIQKVNTMGMSGNSKMSSQPAMVQSSSRTSQDNLSSSLNGKRKRDDRHRDYPRESAHAASSSSTRRISTDKKSQQRNSTHHSTVDDYPQEQDFSSWQPLRRTRSLARQIEQLGIPASQTYDDNDEFDRDTAPVASTSKSVLKRNNSKQLAAETDDDTESVERSIAEMSLDEITENGEEEDEEEAQEQNEEDEDEEVDAEDAYLLNEASVPQLHRLRKDHLLRLVAGLQHEDDEQDRSDYTKDMLVKMILDNRDAQADQASDGVSEEAESESSPENTSSAVPVLGTRHATRRTSANNSAAPKGTSPKRQYRSLPTSSSPQRPQINRNGRSRSFTQIVDSSSSASSSSDNDERHHASHPSSSPQQQRRRRTASGVGLGLPKFSNSTEKTPGRLRSGKLRQASSVMSSSDAEKENRYHGSHTVPGVRRTTSHASVYEDEDDAPTPIARRTRHRRNISTASAASSAGFGDDEEAESGIANGEYRLRKISLPRRAATKRNSVVEVSEDEEEEEEEDELNEDDEQGSVIDHGEDDEEDEEEEEAQEHEDPIDLSTATKTSLLRLRRDALVQMCQERDLEETGTKADLATALLDWCAENGHADEEGDADQSEQSASSDPDDEEDAEDEDFEPADVSMETVSSVTSVESSSTVSSHTPRSDATTRAAARKETKTQALAKLSNKRQSYDKASRDKPLLLKSPGSKAQLVHSPRPNTPPGSGDAQDNDLELDLESLNLLDKEIHPDKLKRGEKIGSGGFKDVYEGRYRNVKVALADIRGHLTENDIKELGLLRDLRHENIVRFIGVSIPSQSDVPVTIVTELCANGDLFDYIRNTPAPPLEKILSIMLNIAKGLEYLHKRKPATIHRDMKSSNVLVTAKGVAKIADFGLARVKNSTRSIIKSLVGTVNWQAPELWVPHPRYNEKVDVYSAAMVFWECLQWHLSQKRYPFEGMNEHAIYQEVGQKHMRPSTATMRRQWGGDILDLVEKMWAQVPSQRPSMPEVVKELESLLHAEKARARAAR